MNTPELNLPEREPASSPRHEALPGGFGTCTDIDDQKRAADSMRFLAEASGLLASSSLNYEATLAALTRLVVPRLADWCAIEVANEDGTTRQVEVAHVDPAKARYARELRQRYPPRPEEAQGVPRVIRTGQPVFLPDIPEELLVASARDEEHLRISRELGLRSAMVLPLMARGRTLGALTLVNAESHRCFTQEDFTLAEQLAARAALAVDNARLYRDSVAAEERFRSLITATAQAASNLVGNAVQYSPEDSPVAVTARDEADGVCVQVHNLGLPIPTERLPHIFDPFVRGLESSRGQARMGLGLGLYITYEIVRAHSGTLRVTSTEADGTRFWMSLPRHTPAALPAT